MNNDLKVVDLYNKANPGKIGGFKRGVKSSYSIQHNYERFDADLDWIQVFETHIPYLQNIMKNPHRFIIDEEDIVKVEKAKKITSESIKHLSRHTNFIQKIEDNGDVKPSKILNINKEESFNTYENRVIYTLIQNMTAFMEIKKRELNGNVGVKDLKKCQYSAMAKIGKETVDINVMLDTKRNEELIESDDESENSLAGRLKKLDSYMASLRNAEVYKTLDRLKVARVIPPIKRTNLILKNVNFQYAMKLWTYIQDHMAERTVSNKQNNVLKGDPKMKEMFDDAFLLNYLVVSSINEEDYNSPDDEKKGMIDKATSNMINKIVEINADLTIDEVEKMIGEKISIIKTKKIASLIEIEEMFNEKIKENVKNIYNFE